MITFVAREKSAQDFSWDLHQCWDFSNIFQDLCAQKILEKIADPRSTCAKCAKKVILAVVVLKSK